MKRTLVVVVWVFVVGNASLSSAQEETEQPSELGELGTVAVRVAPGVGVLLGDWAYRSSPGFTFGLGAGVHLTPGVRPEFFAHYFEMVADGSSPRLFSYFLGFRFILDLDILTIEPSLFYGYSDGIENCVLLPDGRNPCYDPTGWGPRLGLGINVPITDSIAVGIDPTIGYFSHAESSGGQKRSWVDVPLVLTVRFAL